MKGRWGIVAAVMALFVLAAAACGSGGDSSGAAPATTSSTLLVTYGPQPSASAKMICAREAQEEIAASLGVKTKVAPTPKWADHVYSCNYVYPNGVMKLSVHEVPDIPAARAEFARLAHAYGRVSNQATLGQGAFHTRTESMVVLKDNKVLYVDVSGIPARFGDPAMTRSDVALSVAVTIMGCWTGA